MLYEVITRGGPLMKRLADDYHKATGLDCKKEHGEWNAAHKILLAAGIPTIEQMGRITSYNVCYTKLLRYPTNLTFFSTSQLAPAPFIPHP